MSHTDEAEDQAEDQDEFQVFVKGDRVKEPVRFFLHKSLTPAQQEKLERDIENNGGIVCEDENDADTVLAHHESLHAVATLFAHRTIYVEPADFVKRCLRGRKYYHNKLVKKPLGGRVSGAPRTEYTAEDDFHLVEYIARRIPDKEAGGRTGNRVYQELCDDIRKEDYPWAARHSWQSWRNRYKNNKERFDAQIDEYLVNNPPHPDGLGEYPYDQRLVGMGRRRVARGHRILNSNEKRGSDDETEEENDQSYEEEAASDSGEIDGHRAEKGRAPGRKLQRETSGKRVRSASAESNKEGKRKKAAVRDVSLVSTPEQARRGQQYDSTTKAADATTENTQNILDDNELIRFDRDGDDIFAPDFEEFGLQIGRSPPREAGPSNTQATLVATQAKRRSAARNRERSASAKRGATGRTIVLPSPTPQDTQATIVASQTNARLPAQPQARQHRLASNSASGNVVSRRHSQSIDELDVNRGRGQRGNRGQQDARFETTNENNNIDDVIVIEDSRPSKQRKDSVRQEASNPAPAKRSSTQSIVASRPHLLSSAAPAPTPRFPGTTQQSRARLATQRVPPTAARIAAPQPQSGRRDASYRNTRARSRSLEPEMMPPPPRPASNLRRRKAAMQAVEEQEENADHEGNIDMADAEESGDQQSIDLVEDTLAMLGEEEEEEEEEEGEEADEQASGSDAESESTSYIVKRAKYIAREKILNTVDRTSQLSHPFRSSLNENREEPLSSQSRIKATPHRQESSESEFPTAGTRAKEARARQEQIEKGEPYTPTPGSRAEKARANRERARTGRLERLPRIAVR